MNLINGKKISEEILEELKKEIQKRSIKPCLGVILVGDDKASHIYVNKKEESAERIGIKIKKYVLDKDVSEKEILETINILNLDNQVNGILIQLPLPQHISSETIIKAINPEKDVDGFLSESKFDSPFILAIERALNEAGGIENKKVVALVNSEIFGQALKLRFNIEYQTQINDLSQFDVIITALGQSEVIKESMIKSGVILIDGGISKKNGKIVGDVDRESVRNKVSWLSPVPGGLGPMTVSFLLKNVVLAV